MVNREGRRPLAGTCIEGGGHWDLWPMSGRHTSRKPHLFALEGRFFSIVRDHFSVFFFPLIVRLAIGLLSII